jgi:lipopolysaccharide export system permease protein
MISLDRYILRTTLISFALVLVTLTGVIWVTQALREIDLMTSQGQTILTFLGLTSMAIPVLVLIIAPIALMISVSHTLTKLATDSEIIVMNAAGLSPLQLLRPFLYATLTVAVLITFLGAYIAPSAMRQVKAWDAEITADILTHVLKPGRFVELSKNLTIRIRERGAGGLLLGIFIDDRRDPKERNDLIADHGTVLKNNDGSFLVLSDGHLESWELGRREPTMIAFGQYAFDMSKFAERSRNVSYGTRERYLWELTPPDNDPAPGQYRAEFHDRLTAPIYALAFSIVTFGFLGSPRTTRQSHNFSMACAILTVFGVRMAGFAFSVLSTKHQWAAPAQYLILTITIATSIWIIVTGRVIEPPAALAEAFNAAMRAARRFDGGSFFRFHKG